MSSAKAETQAVKGWGCVFLTGLISCGLAWVYSTFWGEREGTIKTDDCRATILLKEKSFDTWFKKFTCSYRKTAKGEIMGGYCQAVDISSAGVCDTAYLYYKSPPNVCADPKFPYLGEDDKCYSQQQ